MNRVCVGSGFLVALSVLTLIAAPGTGRAEVLPESSEIQKQTQSELDKQTLQRRKARAMRRTWKNMRVYQDGDGVIALTNRPDKFQHRTDFIELVIHYDQIEVPTRFREWAFLREYTGKDVTELARYYAGIYLIDENVILAVIKAESNFDAKAVSRAGARGLMQLMPATAAEMGVTDIFDPAQNIAAGTQYLAKLLNIFDNELDLALAAYNSGPSTVERYGGIPPYKETQSYVKRVNRYAARFAQGGIQADYAEGKRRYRIAEVGEPEPDGYIIHFHNGLTQPADRVVDQVSHYYVEYKGRAQLVRKKFVKEIVEAEKV